MHARYEALTRDDDTRQGSPSIPRTTLLWTMGLVVVLYTAGLALQDGVSHPIVDLWLSLLGSWIPAAVCWMAVLRVGYRRGEILLSAIAVTALATGDTYYAPLSSTWSPLFPSPGDLGYMIFYLLMLAELAVLARRDAQGRSWSVWLDCLVGSLGAASVLAVLLSPVLASAVTGRPSLATVVAIAYPLLDLLLVAAVTGIVALGSIREGSRWFLLVLGLLVITASDVGYALQTTAGTYAVGKPLDAGWTIGLALIALWVNGAERRRGGPSAATRPTTSTAALWASSLATAAGLGVLLLGTRTQLSGLAVVLAGVTLLAAGARTQLAFRHLTQMANLRRMAAATDDLTGLPNRRALYAEGRERLMEPQRCRQALLMLDLDKFKEVNDSLGHHAGDLLLVEVGARLQRQLRAADMLARLGGDEFAVLIEDAGHDEAVEVAVRLRASVAEPFSLEDITLHGSASVGIALFPEQGTGLSTLLRKADIAMYKAKTPGIGYHVYTSADGAGDTTRLRTVEELRTAMTGAELVVHYQPKIDMDTGTVNSVEALVRWDHPTRGLLYPDDFLSLVESSGLMPTLTRVVLTIALDQAAIWHAQGRPLTVAVNLSASALVDADLPGQVASMLGARDLPAGALQVEITEDFLMADRDRARAVLSRLRHSGVQISVDDFGSGYSSLGYLRDLPIDELKLDRSFISPLTQDERTSALVASTIDLAHSLGLRMVAEGVESHLAYSKLARLGCDQAQGFWMSRPVPAAELDLWLGNRHPIDRQVDIAGERPTAASG
ncbi:MAG: EAL domain-containing protein [Dermatophilaceae bacterium]|nr:EAL domain-containing protein [Dermatophilaceae bacterium]